MSIDLEHSRRNEISLFACDLKETGRLECAPMTRETRMSAFRLAAAAALCWFSLPAAAMLSGQFKGRYGALEIYDAQSKLSFRVNTPRLAERLSPCETYFLAHTGVALTLGVIKEANSTIAFDATQHPDAATWPELWRRDHTFDSALKNGVPWYAAALSTRVGQQRLGQQLKRIKYGNADISGGLGAFWSTSSLKITGLEQVDFIRNFRDGKLGFASAATQRLKRELVLEQTPDYTISGIAGSCRHAPPSEKHLGWLVGYVERPGKVWYYAMNIDAKSPAEFGTARLDIVRGAMIEMGFIPAPPPVETVQAPAETAPVAAAPAAAAPATSKPKPKPKPRTRDKGGR
jgi:beta-lactamase class D/beta-lactamase class D OXA-10